MTRRVSADPQLIAAMTKAFECEHYRLAWFKKYHFLNFGLSEVERWPLRQCKRGGHARGSKRFSLDKADWSLLSALVPVPFVASRGFMIPPGPLGRATHPEAVPLAQAVVL